MEDFDWVTALSDCSAGEVFLRLKQQVESDIEIRQDLCPEGIHYRFRFMVERDTFSAVVEGHQILKQVVFSRKGKTISVKGENANFDATVTLDETGKCKVRIDGQERDLWHLRKKALERLFFDDY
jgi:hypothetical protein